MGTRRLSELQSQLYEFINILLPEKWDSIGINDTVPREEYQSYTPHLFDLAIKGATVNEIANQFAYFERKTMGIDNDEQKCEKFAEKIVLETKKLGLT